MVMSSTFVVLSKLLRYPPSIAHRRWIAKLTMVRLLQTCLSSIAQMEMPLNSHALFEPFRLRRRSASVSEIPLLEDLIRKKALEGGGLLCTAGLFEGE